MTRVGTVLALAGALIAVAPASAQFFMKAPDIHAEPVRGDEPGLLPALPDATDAELRASLVWNLRTALNIAALQCQFEPTLNTVSNWEAVLLDHKDEMKAANDTLAKYFVRVNKKSQAAGRAAYDAYGTRIYSSFSAVAGQLGFCQTAASVGRDAIEAPRGQMATVAAARMRELRASLAQWTDQQFPRYWPQLVSLPRLDPNCFLKNDAWDVRRCGPHEYATPRGITAPVAGTTAPGVTGVTTTASNR